MTELCQCPETIDNAVCQCSLRSSDCIDIIGSGRTNALRADPILDASTDNLMTCTGTGLLVELPVTVRNPPRAQAFHNANQSTTSDAGFVVALNSEYFDTDTMHDTTTLNSRLTVVTAGIYVITASASFAANATGDRSCLIRKNGNEFIGGQEKKPASASFETGLNAVAVEHLLVGEWVEMVVKQDSGVALNLLATRYSPVLTALFRRLPPT